MFFRQFKSFYNKSDGETQNNCGGNNKTITVVVNLECCLIKES